MTGIILFGTGSPVIVDVEESLHRAGLAVAAGIRNRPGPCHLPDDVTVRDLAAVDAQLRGLPFLIPLFTPAHRQAALGEARAAGFSDAWTLIDPSVPAPRRLAIGAGSYVNAGCSLGSASEIGAFVFVNRGASLGHHARIGDFASIGPGVVIAGHVTLGRGAVIGAGATVLPELTIGANAVVGGGAVVTRDVPPASLVVGNPARIVRSAIGGYRGLAVG
ncbi:acetyltransferase [Methylobacterium dankookense]|uniref:2,3,4,5-tetrahydropyridine-2,6-dicarboxylate N-acetyltransferase n=1 Tax=Methylobacterium dankookense TaxID=560405 RepID=A0A564G3G6_9HYPH|nr:acetyltransferase [Methylobacterium dankookense]GJD55857.1 2,3,4,5-tetrahydropyridine-2,6-dicarboxylate N-acetyltransferase [Methylobacterium dankookense]VUF14141.1 Putative acetyltransferase EpsM [Methylobacterium dankookense]